MEIKNYSIEELEELAIDEDLDAIKELVRRYREGDGVEANATIANHWSSQLGEDPESADTMSEEGIDEEPDEKTSWDEQYHVMKRRIIGQLREEAVKGNSTALIVLAEKYFNSANSSEINEGFRMLDEAEGILRADLSGEDAAISKEALVYLFNLKGEKLEEEYQRTANSALPERIFKAYSNANELDPTQVEGIAHCYEMGIGVGRDEYKARAYIDQKALQGGIEDKYKIGKEAFDASETMRATEWLQNALLSEDAEEHRTLKHCTRMLLGMIHAADEQGRAIDQSQEYNELIRLVTEEHDAEAALFLASLTDNDVEKLRYYELGAIGTPEQHALICAQNAKEIRSEIEDRERRRREKEEAAALEEQRIALERQREEEQRRRAEDESRRKRALIVKLAVAAVLLIAVIAGVVKITDVIKDKKEREELASKTIEIERTVNITKDAYGYDSSGNKILTLNNKTVKIKCQSENPNPRIIAEDDWESLLNNNSYRCDIPEGVMKNGVEVSVTAGPKDQKIIDAFHEKYGCTVVDKKKTTKIKTDGFTNNVTNGGEFKTVKKDVLEEMKKTCKEDAVAGYSSNKSEIVNTYFLCPTPEKNGYSNAKVVIIVRETEYFLDLVNSVSDIAYIFSGPFGENYTKDSVLASKAETCSEYVYLVSGETGYDIKKTVNGTIKSTECKYEWQEMD